MVRVVEQSKLRPVIRYGCAKCGAELESPAAMTTETEPCPACGANNVVPCATWANTSFRPPIGHLVLVLFLLVTALIAGIWSVNLLVFALGDHPPTARGVSGALCLRCASPATRKVEAGTELPPERNGTRKRVLNTSVWLCDECEPPKQIGEKTYLGPRIDGALSGGEPDQKPLYVFGASALAFVCTTLLILVAVMTGPTIRQAWCLYRGT